MEIKQEFTGTGNNPRMVALAMAFLTTAFITTSVLVLFAGNAPAVSSTLAGI